MPTYNSTKYSSYKTSFLQVKKQTHVKFDILKIDATESSQFNDNFISFD